MATYNELASNYASNKRQEYENSLGYLTEDLTKQYNVDTENLANQYNNLLNTLNTNYANDTRAAYVNKVLAGNTLDESLANMGVSSQGFGATQRLMNENNYSSLLGSLQTALSNDTTNAGNEYQSNLSNLQSNYLGNLASMKQNIQSMADKYEQQQYSNYLNDLQYQDQLALQYANAAAANNTNIINDNNIEEVHKATYSPTLSSGSASKWFASQVSLNGMSITQLAKVIANGLDKGYINEADKKKIYKAYGFNV